MHYHRQWRTGQVGEAGRRRIDGDPRERWQQQVSVQAPGCWIWTGHLDKGGYGEFQVTQDGQSRSWRAHRWVYTVLVRDLLDVETIDHLCRVHACVNPDHLDPVSHAVNSRRGAAGTQFSNRDSCSKGHPYTEENTRWIVTKRGTDARECITCARRRARDRMWRWRGVGPDVIANQDKTHCKHGHEFTPENTIRTKSGRNCRECQRIRIREYMRKKRAAAKA